MKISAWILIFLSIFTFVLSVYNIYLTFTHPIKFKDEIVFYANHFDFPPELVSSVINVESSFKENARSNKNAIGLMQIKLGTANYLNTLNHKNLISEEELFTPSINIFYGCAYLKYLMKKFEDINTSLAAYNAGETKVREWLISGIYSTD